jgi:hypothetical protein
MRSTGDKLVAQADVTPLPASGDDPQPVNGDVIDMAAFAAMYSKFTWPFFANALAQAQAGDGTGLRALADFYWGRLPDGTYDPITDRYFMIGAIEQKYPTGVQPFLDAGDNSWGLFDHFWSNTGYVELNYGLWPIHARDAFSGPFRASKSSPTILEVATTYDPATSFRGAKRLAAELGNVRFLTMVGDGHTAFGGNSACIDDAVVAQIETLTLPPVGTICQQQVPFLPPPPTTTSALRSAGDTQLQRVMRSHVFR